MDENKAGLEENQNQTPTQNNINDNQNMNSGNNNPPDNANGYQNNHWSSQKHNKKNNPLKNALKNKLGGAGNKNSSSQQTSPAGNNGGNANKGQNHGRKILNKMKKNAQPNDQKPNDRNKKIERAAKLAKHAPIPQVKAAATAIEKLQKTKVGKMLGSKFLGGGGGGLLGAEEGSPEAMVVAAIRRKIVVLLLPVLLIVVVILLIVAVTSGGGSTTTYAGTTNGVLCMYDTDVLEEHKIDKKLYENCDNAEQRIKDYYERVKSIRQNYIDSGQDFNPAYIEGYRIAMAYRGDDDNYDAMDEETIELLADSMFKDGSFDEDYFRKNLVEKILPAAIPGKNKKYYEKVANEIFEFVENFENLYHLFEDEEELVSAGSGVCTYNIKSVSPTRGSNVKLNIKVTDLHVKLLQCGGKTPISGESPVPFEDYILGVAFGEIGSSYPAEAIKTQLVAARSYALVRPTAMNNAVGLKLGQEKGKWILRLRNCVNDQAYCNPDKGCSSDSNCGAATTIYSGHGHATKCLGGQKLGANDKMRSIADSVQGQVLVNSKNSIVNAPYVNTDQEYFKAQADKGLDYKQILIQKYGKGGSRNIGATGIKQMDCSAGDAVGKSGGPYAKWKQYTGPWTQIRLGKSNNTIKSAGCLATSIAMQIARSGTKTTVKGKFNPGSFVKTLSAHGGFDGSGCLNWGAITSAAPNFKLVKDVALTGSRKEKAKKIKEVLDKGYYPVVSVKNEGHWIAVDSVSGNNVTMMDPGSTSTNLWSKYTVSSTTRMVYFKAS